MFKNKPNQVLLIMFAVIFTSGLLFLILYKTFCGLNQIIDWNAVSSIIEIVVMIFTGTAIYIAIIIPQKDRIKASRVELFTQRFDLYYSIKAGMSDYFESGSSRRVTMNDLSKNLEKTKFLIDDKDSGEVYDILQSIMDKETQKDSAQTNAQKLAISIFDDLERLTKIFEKYLSLRDYGINI